MASTPLPVRELGVKCNILLARINGRQSKSASHASQKALNPIQERILISWVASLHKAYTYPTPDLIENAANYLGKGEDRDLGHNWVYRFIERLPPTIHYITQKHKEKARMDSEDVGSLTL